jgi:hypothetical protein
VAELSERAGVKTSERVDGVAARLLANEPRIDRGPGFSAEVSVPYRPASDLWRQTDYFVSSGRPVLQLALAPVGPGRGWRAATACLLVVGALALLYRLREYPRWHAEVYNWPHALALVFGFAWWLLLRPSAFGFAVMVLTVLSWCLRKWRGHGTFILQDKSTQSAHMQL